MKKKFRVKKESDFQEVFNSATSCANRNFVVYQLPKAGQKHFRVGLSVGKKIGNAVARNQMKRYLRQGLQELEPGIVPEVDFIIIARVGSQHLDYHQVKKNLTHVLKLANLYQESVFQKSVFQKSLQQESVEKGEIL
ncbi:ribonuclease P protein component [Enterococcus timonensis]|uniref:ribonuclease P protein component n=1 Tax=Enterococcus timonensis TaxID=1852364 RepID=UPI0008D95885|nr:ribonuclease P protein component [Enterococcus timonensis]